MKASVIICYTNSSMKEQTLEYLNNQDCRDDFEIIAIDNRENKFTSASKALNYGASIAKGEILVFMHQDVFCEKNTHISELLGYFDNIQELALIGVAGIDKTSKTVCSNITETTKHIVRYPIVIDKLFEVETIDECLMAIRKKDFDEIKFDEVVCDKWDFYGVDLSYQVSLRGGKVYCAPLSVCHISTGNITINFYKVLRKMGKKYKGVLSEINSTCIQTENDSLRFNYYVFRPWCGQILRKMGLRK